MASPTVLRVEGAPRLRSTLRKAGSDLQELKDAHKEVGAIVEAAGKAKSPRQSGELAGTVRHSGTKTTAVIRAGGAKKGRHAQVIHWGWPGHNITANPFLTDAAKQTEPRWREVYEDAVEQALNNIKGV